MLLAVNDVSIRYIIGDFKDLSLKEFVMRKRQIVQCSQRN